MNNENYIKKLIEDSTTYKVKLIYFKETGEFYSQGEYKTFKKNMHDVINEVKYMKESNNLPYVNDNNFIVYVYSEEIPYPCPHLII